MKLLRSTKKDADSDKKSETVPQLEPVEVPLVHSQQTFVGLQDVFNTSSA